MICDIVCIICYIIYYVCILYVILYIVYTTLYIIYVYCTSIITESRNYNCNLELVYGSLLFCVPRETCLLTHLHHLSFSF